jgi:hypothetical protein
VIPDDIDDKTRAAWTALGRRLRRAQGLPPKITDPVAIARIAAIVWPEESHTSKASRRDVGAARTNHP